MMYSRSLCICALNGKNLMEERIKVIWRFCDAGMREDFRSWKMLCMRLNSVFIVCEQNEVENMLKGLMKNLVRFKNSAKSKQHEDMVPFKKLGYEHLSNFKF